MLFWRVLFVIVKNLPSGLNPHSWPDVTTVSSAISQIPSAIFLTGMLSFGVPSGDGDAGNRFHSRSVDDDADGEHPQGYDREAVAGMMHRIVGAGEVADRIAWQLTRVGEILAHRNHFPVELVALCPAIVVFAGFRRLHQPRDAHLAAAEPVPLKRAVRFLAVPVETERRYDLRLCRAACPREERDDVLLPIRSGKSGGIRIDDGMHADADTRRLGDVLEQVHLLAVETNSIDLVALPPERVKHTVFLHLRRDAVDQYVLAALGRVDELEALTRVGRRERGQMVRYGTAVAIVPVFDPGHRLTAGKVLHLRSAAQLRRRQPDIIAECPDTRQLHLVEIHSGGRSSAATPPPPAPVSGAATDPPPESQGKSPRGCASARSGASRRSPRITPTMPDVAAASILRRFSTPCW